MPLLDTHRLDLVDWDFPRAGTESGSVHSLYSIPGNFIPQIPSALIQILSSPGDLVLDPFGGSGTTLIEALRLGRNAIASDIISACLITSEAKLSAVTEQITKKELDCLLSEMTFEHLCRTNELGANGEGGNDELLSWYEHDTLSQLRWIWKLIETQQETIKKQLVSVFSNTLFACASTGGSLTKTGKERRHHWGWIADNVKPKLLVNHNAIAIFRQKLTSLTMDENLAVSAVGKVLQEDSRCLSHENNSIDLVVTSPPYVGVIDYTDAHRMLYLWMGWSLENDRASEIGARFRRFRKHAVAEYLDEMSKSAKEIHRVLKNDCCCAVVIGESKKFPGAASQVMNVFERYMPIAWGPKTRYLSRRRVSDRQQQYDPFEYLCIFQKK